MKSLLFCLGLVLLVASGCVTPQPVAGNGLRIPHNTAIVIPPEPAADLKDLKAPAIKTGPGAGSFALVNIPPFSTTIGQGPNEVRIRNGNTFPVLVILRSADKEKGLNLEFPAKSISILHLPAGGYQISYVFSNVPNAIYRGDHIHLPALTRPEIGIPVSSGN